MFEISYEYDGCPGDNGWFLITEQHCDWEKQHPEASILYRKQDHKVNFNQYGMKKYSNVTCNEKSNSR